MLQEELFAAAAQRARERIEQEQPSELPEHAFSAEFEAQIEKDSRILRRTPWQRHLRRAAVLLLACFVGLSACLMGVEAWREQLVKMVEERFPDHSRITFEAQGDPLPDAPFIHYAPSVLPDGFVRTFAILDDHWVVLDFEDGQGNSISYDQMSVKGSALAINTEGAQFEEVTVAGKKMQYLTNLGQQSLLWNDDRYCYTILTNLPREQLLAVAESVTIAEPLESTPEGYDQQMAVERGEVLISPEKYENTEQIAAFVEAAQAGKTAELCIGQFFADGWQRMTFESSPDGLIYRCDANENPASNLETLAEWRIAKVELQPQPDGKTALIYYGLHSDEPTEAFVYQS